VHMQGTNLNSWTFPNTSVVLIGGATKPVLPVTTFRLYFLSTGEQEYGKHGEYAGMRYCASFSASLRCASLRIFALPLTTVLYVPLYYRLYPPYVLPFVLPFVLSRSYSRSYFSVLAPLHASHAFSASVCIMYI
jgi:hypothetical protein